MRSEDDLRAAFTAKAGEAPSAERVARAVRRAEARPPDRRRWLAPVIGVAAAAAVGVPLGLAISHSPTNSSKKDGAANRPASQPAGAPAAGGAGSRGAASAGSAGSAESRPSAVGPSAATLALCGPDDVSVSVLREAGEGMLLLKSRGPACRMARVPSLRWPTGSTTFGTQQDTDHEKPGPANYGVLPVGGFATATVQWNGCGLPSGNVVYVDWGNGPVKVTVAAAPAPTGCAKTPAPGREPLLVFPLDGLS